MAINIFDSVSTKRSYTAKDGLKDFAAGAGLGILNIISMKVGYFAYQQISRIIPLSKITTFITKTFADLGFFLSAKKFLNYS